MTSIHSAEFCDTLEARGFDFFAGVPCSIFNPLYRELNKRTGWRYIPAVREDAAVGIAVGAYAAGRRPVVIMQNSGLGYSLNAFTSLAIIYEVPLLVLISWRGYQGKDAPEHIVMGASMLDLLRDVGVRSHILGEGDVVEELAEAEKSLAETRRPVFLAVRSGVLL
ncbi:MAG: thiamine pyrophosphate-binding protein [Terriglobales bacterium]